MSTLPWQTICSILWSNATHEKSSQKPTKKQRNLPNLWHWNDDESKFESTFGEGSRRRWKPRKLIVKPCFQYLDAIKRIFRKLTVANFFRQKFKFDSPKSAANEVNFVFRVLFTNIFSEFYWKSVVNYCRQTYLKLDVESKTFVGLELLCS